MDVYFMRIWYLGIAVDIDSDSYIDIDIGIVDMLIWILQYLHNIIVRYNERGEALVHYICLNEIEFSCLILRCSYLY